MANTSNEGIPTRTIQILLQCADLSQQENKIYDSRGMKDSLKRIRIQLITVMRIQILPFNMMRIHADPDPQHWTSGKLKWQMIQTVPVLLLYYNVLICLINENKILYTTSDL